MVFFVFGFYGDSLSFDGTGGFLVYVYFFGFGLGGDIYFDVDEFWIFFSIDLYGEDSWSGRGAELEF